MEPDIRSLLDATFTRADWLRLIRRLARKRSVESARLLLRAAFGPPPMPASPQTAQPPVMRIWLPAIKGQLDDHAADDSEPAADPDSLPALIAEALSPADWAALLRWLARATDPAAKRLLWAYQFGLSAVVPPARPPKLVHIYDPPAHIQRAAAEHSQSRWARYQLQSNALDDETAILADDSAD